MDGPRTRRIRRDIPHYLVGNRRCRNWDVGWHRPWCTQHLLPCRRGLVLGMGNRLCSLEAVAPVLELGRRRIGWYWGVESYALVGIAFATQSRLRLSLMVTPNPSIERTNSGLRPPLAAHVER